MIRKITEIIAKPTRDCIYDVMSHINLCLCVDVGAAAGHITKKLCQVGGEKTRVVAFEPFIGNHQHFFNTTSNISNDIILVKKAVSDEIGTAEFIIPSVVQGTEPGWEKYAGYSSVGFLSDIKKVNTLGLISQAKRFVKSRIKFVNNFLHNRPHSRLLKVQTTTIDKEFSNEKIDFMKIDVQGAEAKVLTGALNVLKENRISVLYIEWSGEQEVVDILYDCGYEIYDSTYIVGPKVYDVKPFEEIGFEFISELNLSTGKISYEMIISDDKVSPEDAIREVRKRSLGWIQTDLIVISRDFKEQFEMASCKHFLEGQANKAINTGR